MKEKGKKNKQNKDTKKQRSGTSYSESVRAKWFCCVFKLGFVQLICKASLIFKSNLELALSIILILLYQLFLKMLYQYCKGLLRSAINKRNKELQHISKELSQSENVLSKHFIYLLLTSTSLTDLKHLTTRNRFKNH